MDIYPFETLYIADLNSIQKIGIGNIRSIDAILNAFPEIEVWLDAGVSNTNQSVSTIQPNIKPVLGTESFHHINDYINAIENLQTPTVLSLDFLADGYQGPIELLQNTLLWPKDVIVMTLNKVGANAGVDLNTIHAILAIAKQQHIYAAGGIRNIDDLNELHSQGIHGALIASALHNQQINNDQISRLIIKKPE
jgi:phosphoribosylformimino-5-aminoimidazole carboxamide ribotide isomerase